jgi:hypothetical protein
LVVAGATRRKMPVVRHTHTQKKSRTYYTNVCLNNCIIRPYCRHKCVPCYLII